MITICYQLDGTFMFGVPYKEKSLKDAFTEEGFRRSQTAYCEHCGMELKRAIGDLELRQSVVDENVYYVVPKSINYRFCPHCGSMFSVAGIEERDSVGRYRPLGDFIEITSKDGRKLGGSGDVYATRDDALRQYAMGHSYELAELYVGGYLDTGEWRDA